MIMVSATDVLRKIIDHLFCISNDVWYSDFQMYKEDLRETLESTLRNKLK